MSEYDYKRAYEREKKQRITLEILFEQKTYELYHANEQLKVQQENLVKSEKLASIGQLATGIAHEINNPLAYVSTNIDLLLNYSQQLLLFKKAVEQNVPLETLNTIIGDFNVDKESFKYMDVDFPDITVDINEGIKRIKTIVSDVSSYANTRDSAKESISINKAILSTLHLMKSRLIKGIKLETNFSEIPEVRANINEVKQVILNLCINALDAMNNKGLLKISTSFDSKTKTVTMSIKDTGIGLSKANQLKIFDPFFTSKSVGKGTGLGLYISYQIIAAHGGYIDLISEEGGGAEFIIHLPVENSSTETTK
jgi:signal transduction histidine kinase